VLSFVVYAWHIRNGGWYLDDWELIYLMGEAREADGPLGAIAEMAGVNHRPGNGVVYPSLWFLGGDGQAPYNLGGALLAALSGALLHLALRSAGVVRWVAAAVGAGYVALPVVDSARLWFAAYVNSASVILALAGLLLACSGLRRTGRAAVLLHAGALFMYAWATLTYELVAGMIGLFAISYAVVGGWRAALRRWPADLLVVGAVLAFMAARQVRGANTSLGFLLDRAGQFPGPAWDVFSSLLPFEGVVVGPVGAVLVVAGAVGVGMLLAADATQASIIRHWTVLGITGGLFAVAGWALLLPADAYFVPRLTGMGNRVTIVAGPGLLLLLVALLALTTLGLAALARRVRFAWPVAVIALAVVLVGFLRTERDNQRPYVEAWTQQQRVLAALKASVGPPAPGTRYVTFRHPTLLLPADVSVFYYPWDLQGAVRYVWDDGSLIAHPYIGRGTCTAVGWDPQNDFGSPVMRYGELYFVDTAAYEAFRIRDQRTCRLRARTLGAATS